MALHVFVVVPYAGKWGVSADDEVLATADTKSAAENLARKAAEALRPAGRASRRPEPFPLEEPRSFADG